MRSAAIGPNSPESDVLVLIGYFQPTNWGELVRFFGHDQIGHLRRSGLIVCADRRREHLVPM